MDQTDGQLLREFLGRRDEAAFVSLVRRHGPMVLGVCRRVLGDGADAEDAFQATFLVLVRRAASLTARPVLGDWLHGVARRTALSARRACARRRAKEQAMARPDVQGDAIQDDWLPLLDEELSRLPENYRLPIVLCDLEGRTRREVAGRLGWPEGTVAGRLARGRALLAKRLARHAGVMSSGALAAVLAQNVASACVSESLLHSTARAARLFAAGTGAATTVVSAKVAALSEGVVRAMFLAKLKTVTCVLILTALVGLGGVALRGAGSQPADPGAVPAPHDVGDAKPDADPANLVKQLGSANFLQRQAAEKALAELGAHAADSVRAGMKNTDLEIANRCTALWPRLWQAEIDRPDAKRLAGCTHPLWARFSKAAGDSPASRTLFAEMASDVNRFSRLEAVEADPAKAGAAYGAELKQRNEAIERGTREAMEKFKYVTGPIVATSGRPTRPEFVTVLFLGTYPATAKDDNGDIRHNVFSFGIGPTNGASAPIRVAFRRLYAAWLAMRTAPQPLQIGLRLAFYNSFAEVAPIALVHAANDKLDPTARGFALLGLGRFGSAENLPVVEKAFADKRVFLMSNFTFKDGKHKATETRVSDTAVACALRLAKQDPADFGFTFMEMYRKNSMRAANEHNLIGFFQDDDAARQAAHKKAIAWLKNHPVIPWSEPVEGLQCWLKADKAVWKTGEVPSFRLHCRDEGKRDLVIHMAQCACKLEFDGAWFDWQAPVSIPCGTWPAGGKYEDFDVRVTLEPPWSRDNKPIALQPGKHKVRVAYITLDLKQPVRVVSNAVEIQVTVEKAASPMAKAGPMPSAPTTTGDQALDGLWEDIENKGAWLRFDGSTIKWHPASSQLADLGRKEDKEKSVLIEWTCRYNLAPTPMTIDIFQKDGTTPGIFVFERDTLFIALAQTGAERPTRFKRDDATTLFVLKRPAKGK